MTSSFHGDRPAPASMTGQADLPKTGCSEEPRGSLDIPEIGKTGTGREDDTKPDPRALGMALRICRGERSRGHASRISGIKRADLAAYEKGDKEPRPDTLARLAAVYEVPLPNLLALADLLASAPGALDPSADPNGTRTAAQARRMSRLTTVEALLTDPAGGTKQPAAVDPRSPEALWERLRPYSPAERRAIVRETPAFQIWTLSRLLCVKSREADDPEEAAELARLAELIAPLVSGSDAWRSRLRGFCAFHVSRALEAGGQRQVAEEAERQAGDLWQAGGDPGQRLDEALPPR